MRISCPDEDPRNPKGDNKKVEVPIIADIHFHYQRAIEAAKAASCLRINPETLVQNKELRR